MLPHLWYYMPRHEYHAGHIDLEVSVPRIHIYLD